MPGLLTGTPAFVVASQLGKLAGSGANALAVLVLVVGFGTLALVLSRHARRPNWSGAAGLLVGVSCGFLVDLQLDAWASASTSHSLLPFEVVSYYLFIGPAVVAGTQVASDRARHR